MSSSIRGQRQVGKYLLAPLVLLTSLAPATAADYLSVETTIYEWVEEDVGSGNSTSLVAAAPSQGHIQPSFGPFRVVSPERVELDGSIESNTPALFRQMLKQHPGIRHIVMIDCPGTGDDEANLALARIIRRHGISTHVPAGGSVRSGGVELFLAGVNRSAHPEAEFAVHSWLDDEGYQANDYGANDPVHQAYIAYYKEMGMSDERARAFYTMTNSVPHESALYLTRADIAGYIALN